MNKTVFFEIKEWEKSYLRSKLPNFNLQFCSQSLNEISAGNAGDADVVCLSARCVMNEKSIEKMKKLRYVTTRSTGYDHIDRGVLKKMGVLVSNVPNYGDNTVAEYVFALLLSVSRRVCEAESRTRKRDFYSRDLVGYDLKGKTIGVVGTGNIGLSVINIAKGFGMKAVAYDINENKEASHDLGFDYISLEDLFKSSDVITLHVPYNRSTHHLINMKSIRLIKRGSFLINTSRGKVCDTTALLGGLKEDIFAGMGLDVLEEEEFIRGEKGSPVSRFLRDRKMIFESGALLNDKRVVVTAHNAYNTKEAALRILDSTADNILAFKRGNPVNLV